MLANGLSHRGQERWFDFWNCRVVLPKRGLWFHLMPHIVSGAKADPDTAGLWVLDGSGAGGHTAGISRVGAEFAASPDNLDVRWRAEGREHRFAAGRINASGSRSAWDVTITDAISDGSPQDARRLAVEERFLFGRVPFIHRVPRMKGYARGEIVCGGETFAFDRGLVYQAHNYGPRFPAAWTWVHALDIQGEDDLAFEAAGMPVEKGRVGIARVATSQGAKTLSSLLGDEVSVVEEGGEYNIAAKAKDGSLSLKAAASHGPAVRFAFPTPDGGTFAIDECFVGELALTLDGRELAARHTALGQANLL